MALETTVTTSEAQAPAYPYPVDLTIAYPERSSRLLALCTILFLIPKVIVLVPHLIVLYVMGLVAGVLAILGQIVVLFTGKYPRGMFDIVLGIQRWKVRVEAYLIGMVDKYPPFSLK